MNKFLLSLMCLSMVIAIPACKCRKGAKTNPKAKKEMKKKIVQRTQNKRPSIVKF